MMETIRIRRAGYPIRHTFAEFVDRYRILVSDIGPSHTIECKNASLAICKSVLHGADFQLGKSKVFLKVSNVILEMGNLDYDNTIPRSYKNGLTFKSVSPLDV